MGNTTNCKLPPAVLFVGSMSSWKYDVERYVSEQLDTPVVALVHRLRWITPATHGYSKEQIDEALLAAQFAGDESDCLAIVCTQANVLLPAAANRLLKIMEEPGTGWHVILCVENEQSVISTLRSRCMVHYASSNRDIGIRSDIPSFVTALYECDDIRVAMVRFQSLREECAGSAIHTSSYLDALLVRWHTKMCMEETPRARRVQSVVAVLMHAYTELPMPGGEILFWRVLLIRMYHAWNVHST